jgi:hypothetical protein
MDSHYENWVTSEGYEVSIITYMCANKKLMCTAHINIPKTHILYKSVPRSIRFDIKYSGQPIKSFEACKEFKEYYSKNIKYFMGDRIYAYMYDEYDAISFSYSSYDGTDLIENMKKCIHLASLDLAKMTQRYNEIWRDIVLKIVYSCHYQ